MLMAKIVFDKLIRAAIILPAHPKPWRRRSYVPAINVLRLWRVQIKMIELRATPPKMALSNQYPQSTCRTGSLFNSSADASSWANNDPLTL